MIHLGDIFPRGLKANCGIALALISSPRTSRPHELRVGCSLGTSVLSHAAADGGLCAAYCYTQSCEFRNAA